MVASRIRYVFKDRRDGAGRAPVFSEEEIRIVRNFHKSFAQYRVTPLHALDRLARDLGWGKYGSKTNLSASASMLLRYWGLPLP